MQSVPSHCGIAGNEAADALAGEAASMAQYDAPLDVKTIYRATARQARYRVAKERSGYSGSTRAAS